MSNSQGIRRGLTTSNLLFATFSITFLAFASSAYADEDVQVPARCGIASIDVAHQSPRNADVSFAVRREPDGPLITDGQTIWMDNTIHNFSYKPKYPPLFAPSQTPILIHVGGTWSGGAPMTWVKSTRYPQNQVVQVFPDHAVVSLYTGADDQDWNSQVTIRFDHTCI